jgi:WD40 repeat protein/ankyrin repeat protein
MVLQSGHTGSIDGIAFSRNGALLATSGQDRRIRLWELHTGRLRYTFPLDGSWSPELAISPDGAVLANFQGDGKVPLWNTTTGKRIRTLDIRALAENSQPGGIAFSPDNETLALGALGDSVTLWNYRTGQRLQSIRTHVGWLGSLVFAPDGSRFACTGDRKIVELWDVRNGTLLATLHPSDRATSLAFSPDNTTLAVESDEIELWDVKKQVVVQRLDTRHSDIVALSYSQDGRTLVSGADSGSIKVWDLRTGRVRRSMGIRNFAIHAGVSADSRYACVPTEDGSLHLFDTEAGKVVRVIAGSPHDFNTLALLADGHTLAMGGWRYLLPNDLSNETDKADVSPQGTSVVLWDLRTGVLRGTLTGRSGAGIAFAATPDSRRLAGSDGSAMGLWDLHRGRTIGSIHIDKVSLNAVALSPDGRLLALGGERRSESGSQGGGSGLRPPPDEIPFLELWDADRSTRIQSLKVPQGSVHGLAFSPDGKSLFCAANGVFEFRVPQGALVRRLPWDTGSLQTLASSRNGRLIAVAGAGQVVDLFKPQNGKMWRALGTPSETYALAVSGDGRQCAASGITGGVTLWDLSTDAKPIEVSGEGRVIVALAFSGDGRRLIGLDDYRGVCVWDRRTGKLQVTFMLLGRAHRDRDAEAWIAYTPDGYYTGSPGVERFLCWRVRGRLVSGQVYRSRFRRPDRVEQALTGRVTPGLYASTLQAAALFQAHLRPPPPPERAKRAASAVPETPTALLRKALTAGWTPDDPMHRAKAAEPVKSLIRAGAAPNACGTWGNSALMFLARCGDLEGMKELLKRKADVNRVDFYGYTALLDAARAGRPDMIELLLTAGADLKDEAGHSLLAIRSDRAALNRALLQALTPSDNARRLHLRFQDSETAYVLLCLGADPNARDPAGHTPLLLLPSPNYAMPLVRLLVAKGANVNAHDNEGKTVLQAAGEEGDPFAIQFLIEHGANVNAADKAGWTPLLWASERGHTAAATVLLERGANPNLAIADDGRTALMFAVAEGYLDLARILLDHGADIDAREHYENRSALMLAVNREDRTAVQMLLDRGADLTVRTTDGRTLIQLVHDKDAQDRFGIVRLLRNAGEQE